MLDGVSIDQLRTFIAAADEGSFSAGGRRLRRAQSVVSQTLANLEAQLGVKLFDRSSRSPVLTKQGVALLAEARAVVSGMDGFKARAKGLSDGLEPELSVVVDVIFPLETAHRRGGGVSRGIPGGAAQTVCRSPGCLSRPQRIRWRQSKERFRRASWRNTGSSSSRTVRSFRREKNSASSPRTPGGLPILARSTPSCAQAWAGAACRWTRSNAIWQIDRW